MKESKTGKVLDISLLFRVIAFAKPYKKQFIRQWGALISVSHARPRGGWLEPAERGTHRPAFSHAD